MQDRILYKLNHTLFKKLGK